MVSVFSWASLARCVSRCRARSEKEEDFKTATIKPRVVFTPGGELKRELAANSYESVRKKEEADKDKKKEDKKKN